MNALTNNLKNECLSPTPDWKYVALNIELRQLCQLENRGDRWCNSIFKQVVRAMYVPKNDLFFAKSSALVCTHFFPQHQAAFGGHGWRKSHPFAKIRLGMPTYMAQVPHTSRHLPTWPCCTFFLWFAGGQSNQRCVHCQIPFRHHVICCVITLWSSCQDDVDTMWVVMPVFLPSWHHVVVTMSTPCHDHLITMSWFFCCHINPMSVPCRYNVSTMSRSCRHTWTSHWHFIIPCHYHVVYCHQHHFITTHLPCHCHLATASLPRHYNFVTIPFGSRHHVIAMPLPGHYHVITTSFPCHDHVPWASNIDSNQ